MTKKCTNPFAGIENAPVEEKLCVLMGVWTQLSKDIERVYYLTHLTAIVAHQYVQEALSESHPTQTKTKRKEV